MGSRLRDDSRVILGASRPTIRCTIHATTFHPAFQASLLKGFARLTSEFALTPNLSYLIGAKTDLELVILSRALARRR
jgi:hypothetical protein